MSDDNYTTTLLYCTLLVKMKKSAGQAKIALITGSSRNICKSIAFSLAKDGYDIILNCRKITAEANQTKKQIQKTDRKVWLITGDVGKESEIDRKSVV